MGKGQDISVASPRCGIPPFHPGPTLGKHLLKFRGLELREPALPPPHGEVCPEVEDGGVGVEVECQVPALPMHSMPTSCPSEVAPSPGIATSALLGQRQMLSSPPLNAHFENML